MNRMLVLVGVAALAAVVRGEGQTFVWNGGESSSWRETSSYKDADTLPGAGDTVEMPENGKATVTDDDAALVAGLHLVKMAKGCELTVNVTTDTVFGCAICGGTATRLGELTKDGLGRLTLASCGKYKNSNGYFNDYGTDLHVQTGTLVLSPDVPADRGSVKTLSYGLIAVDDGATLILPWSNGTVASIVRTTGLKGAGTVSNNLAVTHAVYGISGLTEVSDFSGRLAVAGQCYFYNKQYLNGTNNVHNSGKNGPITYSYSTTYPAVLGLRKIGKKADSTSSIGAAQRIYMSDSILRSLSENDETDKDIYLMSDSATIAKACDSGIDAGEYGGLKFSGGVSRESSSVGFHKRFTLTGSNPTNENVFSGTFSRTVQNNFTNTVRLTKKGDCIWHLKNNAASRLDGGIAVEEGTLRFDSIAEHKGVNCALGTANILTDDFVGKSYSGHMVDYAYLLGGISTKGTTEGTMEYTGENAASCATRPFAICSKGRILSSGGPLSLTGFSGHGSGAKTLTLDGDNGAVNTAADITNGESDSLSVVKAGAGTWRICGELSFSGDLEVRAGTLEVVATPKGTPFSRFRIWFKENAYSSGRYADLYTSDDKETTILNINKMAFFDADGSYLTLTLSDANRTDLAPGTIAFLNRDRAGTSRPASNPFKLSNYMSTTMNAVPKVDDPSTWLGEELWLPENSKQAVSFDFSYYYGTNANAYAYAAARRNVTALSVEGSADGAHWDEIWSDDCIQLPATRKTWLGPSHGADSGRPAKVDGYYGMPFDHAATTNEFGTLTRVASVSVSVGATLKAVGAVTLSTLKVDAAGAGTLDGFAFAEEGKLDVSGVSEDEATVLPLTVVNGSPANVRNWSLSIGGVAKPDWRIGVRDGKLVTRPPRGLVIIVN